MEGNTLKVEVKTTDHPVPRFYLEVYGKTFTVVLYAMETVFFFLSFSDYGIIPDINKITLEEVAEFIKTGKNSEKIYKIGIKKAKQKTLMSAVTAKKIFGSYGLPHLFWVKKDDCHDFHGFEAFDPESAEYFLGSLLLNYLDAFNFKIYCNKYGNEPDLKLASEVYSKASIEDVVTGKTMFKFGESLNGQYDLFYILAPSKIAAKEIYKKWLENKKSSRA